MEASDKPGANPAAEEAGAKVRALLAEVRREVESWPWWRRLWWRYPQNWWGKLTFALKYALRPEPSVWFGEGWSGLQEAQREWEARPRRERLQARFAPLVDLFMGVGMAWLVTGLVVLFVFGLVGRLLVPGGDEWLNVHAATILVVCLAPLIAVLGGMLLWFVVGWLLLPFWLVRGLWRMLRS
jgi:hypothetical protein